MTNTTAAALDRAGPVLRRPVIPLLRAMVRNPLDALPRDVFERPLVRTSFLGRERIYLCDPALIQDLLVRHADHVGKGAINARVLQPALGRGLLTAEGSAWRWQRQAVAPAFAPARLQTMLPAMLRAAADTRERWLALPPGHPIDVGREMMLTTFAIIVDTMLSGPEGIDARLIERCITAYLAATGWSTALGLLGAPRWMPHPGRRRALQAAAVLRGTVQAMVADRRRAPARRDLVSLLFEARHLDTGRGMSDGEITDNLLTFLTAGHETTAQALTWTLHLLATHAAIEDAVVAEIEAVTRGATLAPEHVAALPLTRQVVSEAMRLYPPVPLIARWAERPFTLDGLPVAPGTALLVPIYALHRQERLWPDAGRFDPGRFTGEAAQRRHRYSYLPFGAGPRVCIGSSFAMTEAVAVLASLLPAIRLRAAGDEVPRPTMAITLRPARPLTMRAEPRAMREA